MRRRLGMAVSFAVMAACVVLGWHKGSSPLFGFALFGALPMFAACWWTTVAPRRRT